jgi:hypothetical protein
MEVIQAHLNDPRTPHGKIGFVTVATADDENTAPGACDVCATKYTYVPDKTYPVDAIACKDCKTDWVPSLPVYDPRVIVAKDDDRPETCPDCGGSRKGRGYAHAAECSTLPANKPVKTCEACGGPASGKGYAHKPDCSTQKKKTVVTCSKCGGPRRGRGYTHTADCPEKQAAIAKAAAKVTKAKKRPRMLRARKPRL